MQLDPDLEGCTGHVSINICKAYVIHNQMKNNKYNTVVTAPKSNRKSNKQVQIDTPNIYTCTCSAGFRTNEALCQLSYGAPYLGPEEGRLSTLSLCLESLRNRTPSNLKLHHIGRIHRKGRKMPLPPDQRDPMLKHT